MSKFTEYLEATKSSNSNISATLDYLKNKIMEISSDSKIIKDLNSIKSKVSKIKLNSSNQKILNKTEQKNLIDKYYNKATSILDDTIDGIYNKYFDTKEGKNSDFRFLEYKEMPVLVKMLNSKGFKEKNIKESMNVSNDAIGFKNSLIRLTVGSKKDANIDKITKSFKETTGKDLVI